MIDGDSTEFDPKDASCMQQALAQARLAVDAGEVPVGAIVVWRGQIIGTGYNRREELQTPTAHAEILAIEAAAHALGSWRLSECELYVTLEPCIMCVGAILQARIQWLVFGCLDPKAGAVKSLYRLCEDSRLNHQLAVTGGVLGQECAMLLANFFGDLREEKKRTRIAERWSEPG